MGMNNFALHEMERRAAEFNERYSVENGWTDEQLSRALVDHALPALNAIPDEPRGMMGGSPFEPFDLNQRHQWRRMNAAHLLGHVILHDGKRCDGCENWSQPASQEPSGASREGGE